MLFYPIDIDLEQPVLHRGCNEGEAAPSTPAEFLQRLREIKLTQEVSFSIVFPLCSRILYATRNIHRNIDKDMDTRAGRRLHMTTNSFTLLQRSSCAGYVTHRSE